jgi:hypothetical protein
MSALYPLTLALASLCPAAGGEETVPGRDGRYEFAGPMDLAGTVWKGDMNPNGFLILRFERDGTVCYTYSGGTWHNGNWKQDGDVLNMVIGGAHVKFRAVIRGDQITGEGINDAKDRRRLNVKYVGPLTKEELDGLKITGPRGVEP